MIGDASRIPARSSANNQLTSARGGGVRLFSNALVTTGVTLAANGSAWAPLSDVNSKEHFRTQNGEDVLARIAKMPISEWN